jgi:hypothetical protein
MGMPVGASLAVDEAVLLAAELSLTFAAEAVLGTSVNAAFSDGAGDATELTAARKRTG